MQTVLFIDRAAVETATGVHFALNPPQKHPLNPILLPGNPFEWDSLQVSWPATVLYDASEGRFRCWYAGLDAVQTPGRFWQTGYAESDDGLHWVKPDLGQATYLDRPTNRVVLPWAPSAMLRCVFENPDRTDPGQRFGCLYLETARRSDGASYLRSGLGWSADGKAWTPGGVAYEAPGNDRPAYQDIFQVLLDADDPDPGFRVKGYAQTYGTRAYDGRPNVRHIGLAHGPSINWLADAHDPVLLSPLEGIDEELHGGSVYRVGSTYLMLVESGTYSCTPLHGDLRLAVSADGRRFRRVHPDTPFVATGPRGSWDENLLICTASAMQEVGEEVFIYYLGCPNVYNCWPVEYAAIPERRGSLLYPSYMGVATVARDRFGCVQGHGEVVTRPVQIGPSGLWLNAEGRGIVVEALGGAGEVLARGKLGRRARQTVYRNVVWSGEPPSGAVRLRLKLDGSTRLYSMRH